MSIFGTLGNFAFGTDDWKNAWHEASQGHWGAAAADAGWGALALGSTAALAVPVLGEGVKGAAMAAEAAHLATAGRAAEGVMGAARAARGAETVTSVSRPSVEAYAQGSGREFLTDSFGVGRTSSGAGRSLSRAADQTAYGFPDSVAAGRSPVATLTRPSVKPVTPEGPVWNPAKEPFSPPTPPVKPQPKFDPTTPQRVTRKPPRQPDGVPTEAPTLPETVVEGPGTTLMPKSKILTEEGAATETQLQPKLGPNGRPLPIGVVAPAAGTESPNGTPTEPGTKPKRPRKKGRNDSIWLQVPGQDIEQQVVH